jgi:hypothetical protein
MLVALAAAGGIYSRYQDTRPCVHPIAYAIGTVDPRFGITNATLLAEMKAAAAIWNTAEGRSLLTYDPKAALKISLIYDEREANAKLGMNIARQQADIDSARSSIDAAQAQFIAAQTAYNQKVDAVNARGGASRGQAAELNAERESLLALEESLKSRIADFNADVAALNAVVNSYNQTAGHTFEEGEYVRDSAGERISIFEFVGTTQLKRVLAHEFGHAIGLDHNDDPKSIMYAKNESGNLTPTEADLSALKAACGA